MFHKRIYVKIDLQLHAITCPGVWLCTHGYIEATIKTLGYYFRTGAMEPQFPLLCHDQFTMEGYFKSVGSMDELERVLAGEQVEITLWQNGRRLAYFLGKLSDVMHPALLKLTCAHNVNVQLLMKASPSFPGIIAPKVELSAQIGIQDRLRRSNDCSSRCSKNCGGNGNFVTPNFELQTEHRNNRHCQLSTEGGGSCFSYLEEPRKQKPVCHTKGASCGGRRNSHQSSTIPCGNSSNNFEADAISHKNEQRRLSTCSSHFSNTSYSLSQSSRSSGCSHSLGSNTSGTAAEEHQKQCGICRSYRKAFL